MSPSGETPQEKALRAPQLIEECARILVAYWDPIGAMPNPEAIDEYDSYAPSIADALLNGATHEHVEVMLSEIVRREIGLPVDEERTRLAAQLLVDAAREWDNDELRVNPRARRTFGALRDWVQGKGVLPDWWEEVPARTRPRRARVQVFVFSAETGGRSSPIVPGARPAVVFRDDPHSLYCTRVVGTGAVSPASRASWKSSASAKRASGCWPLEQSCIFRRGASSSRAAKSSP